MTATEELRRLLDERGVEWGNIRNDGSESDYLTEWQCENNQGKALAIEWAVGSGLSVEIHRYHLTPEQAIAATLGAGTCHMRLAYEEEDADGFIWPDHYECDACGANVNGIMTSCDTEIQPRYCPNCGAKVIDPTTNDVDAEVTE